MKSRRFVIHNFRNIGILGDNQSQGTFLHLSGLEEDNLGGLVIILGENNTGKSNLLEAIESFGEINKAVEKHDENLPQIAQKIFSGKNLPNFYGHNDKHPSKLQMDIYQSSYDVFHINLSFEVWEHTYGYGNDSKEKKKKDFDEFIDDLQGKINDGQVYGKLGQDKDSIELIINCKNPNCIKNSNFVIELFCDNKLRCRHIETEIPMPKNLISPLRCHFIINDKKENEGSFLDYLNNNDSNRKHNNIQECTTFFLNDKNGLIKPEKPYPYKIISYSEVPLKDTDLIVTIDNLAELPNFFETLFKIIEVDLDHIKAFCQGHEHETVAYRIQKENIINNKLKKINKQFNDLYNKRNEVYCFRIRLELQQMILLIFKDNQIINLESQSLGFRAFFNFFFNFLHTNKIAKGDIILIDEAETHLSIPAQIELRKFLKSFGRDNGFLFVVTTHSPFMLDMEYLDEIRILIANQDGVGIRIQNNFSFIKSDLVQADTLLKLKEALGVEYFHLLNPDYKPIFVEGITDYNYLTAFKLLYNHEDNKKKINMVFLPISGLGEKNKREDTINALVKFSKKLHTSRAILLVDNDDANMENNNESNNMKMLQKNIQKR